MNIYLCEREGEQEKHINDVGNFLNGKEERDGQAEGTLERDRQTDRQTDRQIDR